MTPRRWIAAAALSAGIGAFGYSFLTAQESEPAIPRQQRVSPKLLKEAMAERVKTTATAPHTVGRTIQDLRALADDLDKGDKKAEANRLRGIIREIVRRTEHEITEKKAQVTLLNSEIEELKWAGAQ